MAKIEEVSTGLSHNVIAQGTYVKGEITTNNDIRIDGSIEGIINSKGKVVVGDKGIISGEIKAANVDIMGNIIGNINATDTLSLKSTGKIKGNIITSTLIIEQGAIFNGGCKMGGQEKEKEKEKEQPAPTDKK